MKLRFWKKRLPKQCCLKCQFLSKTKKHEINRMFTESWTQEERKNGSITAISGWPQYAHCSERIWTTEDPERPNTFLNTDLDKELRLNRKEECYFIMYIEGRTYKVSKQLQPVQSENRKLESTNKNVKIGWMIVIGMGVLGVITQFILHFLK